MKKLATTLMCLLMAVSAMHAIADDTSSNTRIIAGRSVGEIKLGDPSKAVRKIYGHPTKKYNKSKGIKEVAWDLAKSDDVNAPYEELRIVFASDRAIQIKITPARYSLPGGYSTNTTLAQVFQKYKHLKRNTYIIHDKAGGGYQAHFFDDVKAGVAFMVGAQDRIDAHAPVSAIYVHRPNKSVMPDVE